MLKNIILWIVIAVVLMSVFNGFGPRKSADSTMAYSQFIGAVKDKQVRQVSLEVRSSPLIALKIRTLLMTFWKTMWRSRLNLPSRNPF
jgi:ATP-dependent Zn protease